MDKYIFEYHKALLRREKATILDRKYWRLRVIFLHKILKENNKTERKFVKNNP